MTFDTTLTFNQVAVNEGESFHPDTSRFVAPVGGDYFFTYAFLSPYGDLDLILNGRTIRSDVAVKSRNIPGVNTLVIHLIQGDSLWFVLRAKGMYRSLNCAVYRCQFSGYLLTVEKLNSK